MKKILTFLCILSASLLHASYEECGCFTVAGEWLYLMPSFDQSEYVMNGSAASQLNNDLSERIGVDQQFASGYRIDLSYLCCHPISLRYTHFGADPKDSVSSSSDNLYQILGTPSTSALSGTVGDATFTRFYKYDTIEGLVSFFCWSRCAWNTDFQAGAQYAYLRVEECANYFNSNAVERQFLETYMEARQFGPEVAFDSNWYFLKCLAFKTRFQGAFLSSWNRSTMMIQDVDGSRGNFKNVPNFWHVNFHLAVRFGLQFSHQVSIPKICGCLGMNIEGGYEWSVRTKAVNRMYFVDDSNEGFSLNEWSDLTLQGPYVRMNFCF